MTPASIIPVFGSQRPYADLNFAGGSFGLDGRSVRDLTALPGFTFTRASLAMGYDATGKLVYGPNNLCLQSQTFDNAAWVKAQSGAASVPVVTANTEAAPDGTLTADTVAFTLNGGTADGDISQLQQAITSPGPSLFSFWAKTTDGLSKVFTVVGNGGTIVTITITGVWQRFTAPEPLVGSATARLRLRGSASGEGTAASASICLWGAQLEAVTYQTTPSTYYPTTTAAYYGPRFVYDPVTLASQGILVEEARTNLALQNSTLDSATWGKTNSGTGSVPVVTANYGVAPDGTTTADRVQFALNGGTTSSDRSLITQSIAVSNATVYTLSFWVRSLGGNIALGFGGDALIGNTAITATSSWQRVSVTTTSSSTSALVWIHLRGGQTPTQADAADLLIWGYQLEAGTGASSPVPTTTAAVTRAADVAAVTGLAASYPLTMTADFTRNWDAGAAQIVAQVDAGSDAQRSYVSIDASDLLAGITSGSGSSTVAGATVAGAAYKGAARIATDDLQTARGGTLGTADTSATNPTNPTRLVIGGANAAGSPVNGTISRIRIYNRALPDAQLQSLTT